MEYLGGHALNPASVPRVLCHFELNVSFLIGKMGLCHHVVIKGELF